VIEYFYQKSSLLASPTSQIDPTVLTTHDETHRVNLIVIRQASILANTAPY
jgi:hypothetical protein